jgi:hypothetical protein
MKINIKKLNKVMLIASVLFGFSKMSFAGDIESGNMPVTSDLKVKLSGYGHFQGGYKNQNHLKGDDKNVSANRKSFAFFNDAALFSDISNKVNDVTYGGKIVLVPTAKRKGSATYNGSHIYLDSSYGRVEAGSPMDAASNMLIDSSAIASATGGDWDRYAKFDSTDLKQGYDFGPSFATFGEFFLDSKLVSAVETRSYSTEPGRRVSYYTPKFEFGKEAKIQMGISYTPDSSNTGADDPNKNSTGVEIKKVYNIEDRVYYKLDKSVKDAISGGVVLEQNISDGVDLKLALTGEYGKASKIEKFRNNDLSNSDPKKADPDKQESITLNNKKLKDLRTYNIGAILNAGNFSYAASFGSLGKSLTTPEFHKVGRETTYYTGGVAYKQGPFTTSVTYFRSDQYKNTVDCVTIGTDYKLAPGFKPYAEISGFSLKGKPEYDPNLKKKKTRGTIALIGAKLSL